MLPAADIVHKTASRVRLRIRPCRGDQDYFDKVAVYLSERFASARITANPGTASVLVVDSELDLEAIAELARSRKLFDLSLSDPGARLSSPLALDVALPIRGVNRQIDRLTGGAADLPGVIFMALLSFGIIELIRGNFKIPPWYTAFWYAFGLFSKSLVDRSEG